MNTRKECASCHSNEQASAASEWLGYPLCGKCDSLPRAVSVLVRDQDSMVLGVSRKDDHTKFGLPGGKVDPGESAADAITRELREETGLRLVSAELAYVAVCPGGKDGQAYLNAVYISEQVDGDIATDEPHVVKWITWQTLLDGPFGLFNRKLYDFLRFGMV